MNKKKESMVVIMSILLVVTIVLVGISYAYYRTRVIGNSADKSINVMSELLEVTYSDNKAVITADKVKLGYTTKKTFSVENTGGETVNYNIILDNVENEFELPGWEYSLYRVLDDGTKEFITPGVILTDDLQLVESNISIDVGDIHNYELEIVYADTLEDQSDDMGKSISFRVNIEETLLVAPPITPTTVTITYDSMYPDATNVPGNETITYGNDYTLSTKIPERGELYTFVGWSDNTACDNSVSAVMPAGSILQNVTTNITLYACWSIQTG